ncbi:MAG: oligoendopeptidase, partial [Steroidobacteraceae bacterium]|nr:oligoendopeptidase [Steroidobacteraceae bacterium]
MPVHARIWTILAFSLLSLSPITHAVERSEVPEKYRWDLSALYPDETAWAAAKQDFVKSIPGVAGHQGKLGESAASLLAAMTAYEQAVRQAERLYSFAFQRYSEDTRVGRAMQMQQEMSQVYSDFQSAVSFMRPELIAVGRGKIDEYLKTEPRLAQYRMYFDDVLRATPHTLGPAEEKVLARMSVLGEAGGTVQSVLRSADLPFPEVTFSDGTKVRLDAAAYEKYRASPNKADRDLAFRSFWTSYNDFKRTFAATLNSHVLAHVAYKDVRKFPSSVDAALFDYNIPRSVYRQLL